ncbi:negative regulator of flagellin synthesis (anti-sigma factor) [Oceanobacillus iheyensis HTE831]|uniref:Negative regulator of flagellin synthesis n=1 Tax=Oceanobacillus iheyensis (strain DSM 14371 / CIP 107618 / JCM 11309 / KCTC 3954 / HTE831) TaxID=221109 RepID=Q8ENH4_OCEIH|nr:flagellar biosynthesis anti-sigma factor FlgM [Oceanobacillus iheyensis]BAC14465.1 negative regulator of flagellin synthesis (anti-sigma factor) [Oceanobacillus iheyensis HTE831]
MKINGPNPTNFNPYKQSIQPTTEPKSETNKKDQIEISSKAKQLQESASDPKRAAYLEELKKKIDAGEYNVDVDKTAQKMMDFWKK